MSRDNSRNRSGISLLLVVVCLIVITGLVGAMLRNLMLVHRQSKQQMYASQADWLAESAVERAVFLLQRDENYQGELWTVNDPDLGALTGHVDIQAKAEAVGPVTVRTIATFPHGAPFAVKARREVKVTIGITANSESGERDDLNATR